MKASELRALLERVASGELPPEGALRELVEGPFRLDRLPHATLDHHRALRQGLAEVVLAEGKETGDLLEIVECLARPGDRVLVTRLAPEPAERLRAEFPDARWNERARCLTVNPPDVPDGAGAPRGRYVAVVAAGTSDVGVAEEAAEVCRILEVPVRTRYDVGVSGLHRLLGHLPEIRGATAIVVVAGMEGALPSVVAGLVSRPIFAVPTSVGYGTGFGGIAAILSMLNSCAPGVAVLNIDNGFSAGVAAARVVLEADRAARGATGGTATEAGASPRSGRPGGDR